MGKTLNLFLKALRTGNPRKEINALGTYANNFEGLWAIAAHKIVQFSLQNQCFALGVSGGADSIGLFHVFLDLKNKKKISDFVVFHINFGLRSRESDGDEAMVRSTCAHFQVSCHVFKVTETWTSGIQEKARLFRQSIQREFISDGKIVALAHNSDDVAENILLRLARGSSLENAAGMTFFDGEIFRPWLTVPRSLIRESLTKKQIIWRDDSSNFKTDYNRNRIRLEILPILREMFPGAPERMTASFLDAHRTQAANPSSSQTANQPLSSSTLAIASIVTSGRSAMGQEIHDFVERRYKGRSPVSRQIIEQMVDVILKMSCTTTQDPKRFELPLGLTAVITPKEITITSRN